MAHSLQKYSLYFGFVTFFPWGTFHDGKVTGAFSLFLLHLVSVNFFPPSYSLFFLSFSLPLLLSCDLLLHCLKANWELVPFFGDHNNVRTLIFFLVEKNSYFLKNFD